VTQLAAGQTRDLATGRLTVGVGWDKERTAGAMGTGRPDVDLDAAAVQFAAGKLFDLAFYNNLVTRDGSVVHQGDNTSGSGEGDDESIVVDLARVHGPVDTIVLMVSSYQGHSLEWVRNCYCRVADDAGTELVRYTLTLGVPHTGLVLGTLVRSGDGWVFRAVGEGIDARQPTEAVPLLSRFV
jgi:stress response protein SCP2